MSRTTNRLSKKRPDFHIFHLEARSLLYVNILIYLVKLLKRSFHEIIYTISNGTLRLGAGNAISSRSASSSLK